MTSRRIKDIRVSRHGGSWWETIPAAEVMMVRHLHEDHGLSVRQINKRLGMTDQMIIECLENKDG